MAAALLTRMNTESCKFLLTTTAAPLFHDFAKGQSTVVVVHQPEVVWILGSYPIEASGTQSTIVSAGEPAKKEHALALIFEGICHGIAPPNRA